MSGQIRIGVSGWRYPPWRGEFYPKGLPQRKELAYISQAFGSVEINGSFYGLQSPKSWLHWFDETPDDFVFAVKAHKHITHEKRLHDIDAALANFFASGVLALRQKLGPLLWQFPPSFRFDPANFEPFLASLPFDTDQALQLAKRHGPATRDAWLEEQPVRALRHAVEIRHASFVNEDFVTLLRQYGVALVVADTAGRFPQTWDVTADFIYIRLHGATELYRSGYGPHELERWAERIRRWQTAGQAGDVPLICANEPPHRASRDVYCYFDNTDKLMAPADAAALAEKLGVSPTLPECN